MGINRAIFLIVGVISVLLIIIGTILFYQHWWIPRQESKMSGVTNETADWNTYRNEEFGFEIKYPKIYQIGEDLKITTFDSRDFYKEGTEPQVALEVFLRGQLHLTPFYYEVTPKRIGEGEYDAVIAKAIDTDIKGNEKFAGFEVAIFRPTLDLFVLISLSPKITTQELDKMLSTFKFIK